MVIIRLVQKSALSHRLHDTISYSLYHVVYSEIRNKRQTLWLGWQPIMQADSHCLLVHDAARESPPVISHSATRCRRCLCCYAFRCWNLTSWRTPATACMYCTSFWQLTMFPSYYLEREIRYKCRIVCRETTLHHVCKRLMLQLYDAHATIGMPSNM